MYLKKQTCHFDDNIIIDYANGVSMKVVLAYQEAVSIEDTNSRRKEDSVFVLSLGSGNYNGI